jgi:hypothetical protein
VHASVAIDDVAGVDVCCKNDTRPLTYDGFVAVDDDEVLLVEVFVVTFEGAFDACVEIDEVVAFSLVPAFETCVSSFDTCVGGKRDWIDLVFFCEGMILFVKMLELCFDTNEAFSMRYNLVQRNYKIFNRCKIQVMPLHIIGY